MGPRTVAGMVGLVLVASGCGTDAPPRAAEVADTADVTTAPDDRSASRGSIVDVLRADGRFSTLVELYTTSGAASDRQPGATFADVLGDTTGRDWTVLAPTDDAFEVLGDEALTALREGPWLTSVLHRHMIPGTVLASDLTTGSLMTEGGPVEVVVDGDRTSVGGATVLETDLEVDNGVLHVLDAVVLAPHVARDLGLEPD